MTNKINQETQCRICKGELKEVLSLGKIYPSNFVKNTNVSEDMKVPLVLAECVNCQLVQLKHTVDLDLMYKIQYWYRSSLNASMKKDLEDVVREVEKRIDLQERDVVVDIGANDGTLLTYYSTKNLYKIGFDPAPNLKETSQKNCDLFINDYFSSAYFTDNKVRVATLIAMFYDLPDPNNFVQDLKSIMADNGIIVIQMTDLLSMLLLNAIDTICHEHLETYSLNVLNSLLERHGLQIFDLEYNTVNGGSLRVYVSFPGVYRVSGNVFAGLLKENIILGTNYKYAHYGSMNSFWERSKKIKRIVTSFIKRQVKSGKSVFALGASTKGNTLIQYYGIDNSLVPYVLEVNEDKFGLSMIGSNIKIISEKDGFDMNPDYLLVLPWHFKNMLLEKECIKSYMNRGGKLIFPLPTPEVIGKDFVENLQWAN